MLGKMAARELESGAMYHAPPCRTSGGVEQVTRGSNKGIDSVEASS